MIEIKRSIKCDYFSDNIVETYACNCYFPSSNIEGDDF